MTQAEHTEIVEFKAKLQQRALDIALKAASGEDRSGLIQIHDIEAATKALDYVLTLWAPGAQA